MSDAARALDLTAAAQQLATLRADLERDLTDIVGASPTMDGIGFGKRVGDGTGIAVERFAAVGAHDVIRAALEQVTRAEAKVAEAHGRCDVCDEPIPPERLEVRPSATRCMQHPLPSRADG